MMTLQTWLQKQGLRFWIIVGVAGLGLATALDFLTGYEWVWSLIYLLPIGLLTWYVNQNAGVAASFVAAVAAYLLDLQAGPESVLPAVYLWNGIIRLGFFVAGTLLVVNWKKAHLRAEAMNRYDNLTGAVNTRYFTELVSAEIERSRRTQRPFSIVVVNLADFTALSGSLGLSAGNEALRVIANQARSALRKVDVVARLGGDEFAFLLPETSQYGAQTAMTRVQASLQDEMRRHNWSVDLSMGVMTCLKAEQTSEDLLSRASELLVLARQSGQNSIQYADDAG